MSGIFPLWSSLGDLDMQLRSETMVQVIFTLFYSKSYFEKTLKIPEEYKEFPCILHLDLPIVNIVTHMLCVCISCLFIIHIFS